jgi:hypothetical protein
MSNKPKRETALEMHELYVIRQAKNAAPAACHLCTPASASLVTAGEAAIITGVSIHVIYRWAEEEIIHFSKPPPALCWFA